MHPGYIRLKIELKVYVTAGRMGLHWDNLKLSLSDELTLKDLILQHLGMQYLQFQLGSCWESLLCLAMQLCSQRSNAFLFPNFASVLMSSNLKQDSRKQDYQIQKEDVPCWQQTIQHLCPYQPQQGEKTSGFQAYQDLLLVFICVTQGMIETHLPFSLIRF